MFKRKTAVVLTCAMALGWAACGNDSNLSKASYLTFDSNNKATVNTISADGKTQTPVSINVPESAYFIVPNHDATEVVYCRGENPDGSGSLEIFLMGTDNQEKQLTHSATDAENCYPSFSHDGKKIIFTSIRDTYLQTYSMKTDGTGQTHLITSQADDAFPSYSPDDGSFTFVRTGTGVNPAVMTMQNLKAQARMSPKQRLAEMRVHPKLKASATDTGDGIYTAKADGSNPTLVVADTNGDLSYFITMPVFSSDGKRLLFSTPHFTSNAQVQNFQIASVKLDGTDLKNLSNSQSDDYAPFPYGNKILFNRDVDNGQNVFYADIFTMNNDGSNQTNITNTSDTDEYLPPAFF